jgi:protein SCO1/2
MNKSSIAIVALIALVGGFALSWYVNSQKPIELESGLWFGAQARALPEFELVDHRQQPLTRADLVGHWSLMFFGYTHCPDICPVTMQTLAEMVRLIDDSDVTEALQIYLISVDPERDRPEVLAEYVHYFNPDFNGATAAPEQLTPLTRALGIAHRIHNRVEGSDNYDVDHSSAIVLINPRVRGAVQCTAECRGNGA